MPAAQPRHEIGVNLVRRGRGLVRRRKAVRLPDRPERVEPAVKAVGEQRGQVCGQPSAHVVSNRRGPKRAIQIAGDTIPYGTAQRTKEISKRDIAVVAAARCRVARTNECNPRGQAIRPVRQRGATGLPRRAEAQHRLVLAQPEPFEIGVEMVRVILRGQPAPGRESRSLLVAPDATGVGGQVRRSPSHLLRATQSRNVDSASGGRSVTTCASIANLSVSPDTRRRCARNFR
ncbi:hypothetical protein QFZ96_001712 [Paraburkholderia youngii]